MRLRHESAAGTGFAVFAPAALAAQLEEMQAIIGQVPMYALLLFAILMVLYVYSMRVRDRRAAPLKRIFQAREPIHSVAPDASVTECVRMMTSEKIGALLVMEGDKLSGIFTERDALNKVLAAGRDPRVTKVAEVMTKNPFCVPPTTSVGVAMELVTRGRFRHLPVVQDGKVLAIVSSGDLTHWLVKDQRRDIQELVDVADRS